MSCVFLLIIYSFPPEILDKNSNLPFSVSNLLSSNKYKDREKFGDLRTLRIYQVFKFAVFNFVGITVSKIPYDDYENSY